MTSNTAPKSPAFVDVPLYGEATQKAAPRVVGALFDLCEQRCNDFFLSGHKDYFFPRTSDVLDATAERVAALIDAGHEVTNGIHAVRLRLDDWAKRIGLAVVRVKIEPMPTRKHVQRDAILERLHYDDFPAVGVIPANPLYRAVYVNTGDAHQRISPLSHFLRISHAVTPVDPDRPFPHGGFTLLSCGRDDVVDVPAGHSYVVAAPIVNFDTFGRSHLPSDLIMSRDARALDIDKGQVYFSEVMK